MRSFDQLEWRILSRGSLLLRERHYGFPKRLKNMGQIKDLN